MSEEFKDEVNADGYVYPITGCSDHTEMLLDHNGQALPISQVPECETSLCKEKATQKCDLCFTPICNGHAKARICHYCRLSQWMYLNGKGVV